MDASKDYKAIVATSESRRRVSREAAAAQIVHHLGSPYYAPTFWGVVPCELVIQDGLVVSVRITGPQQTIKIAA